MGQEKHIGGHDDDCKDLAILKEALDKQAQELQAVQSHIPGGIIRCKFDFNLELLYCNEGFFKLVGYDREEISQIFNNSLLEMVCQRSKDELIKFVMHDYSEGENTRRGEFKIRTKNWVCKWVHCRANVFKSSDGEMELYCVLIDVTSEKTSREELRQSEEKYKIIIGQSDDIVFEWDFATDKMHFSNKYSKVFGMAPICDRFSKNSAFLNLTHPDDKEDCAQWLKRTYRGRRTTFGEFRILNSAGQYLWTRVRASAILDEGGMPIKAVGVFSNINKEKATINLLMEKARLDPLTKLFNKEETRLNIEEHIGAQSDEKCAFIMIDIDNFKGVNDHLGHQFGDTVLVDIAKRLKSIFRKKDVIGRFGGDEFVVFVKDIDDEDSFNQRITSLLENLRTKFDGEQGSYYVSGSVGISFFPEHGRVFETLYKNADTALYESKRSGKDCSVVYQEKMLEQNMEERTPLESTDKIISNYYTDDLIYQMFEMLYETRDMVATVQKILCEVGKKYGVDRAYIFEHSEEGSTTSNTFEWCADGIVAEIQSLQNIPLDSLADFFSNYSEDGVFYCNDIATLDDTSSKILSRQGIKSVLHCAMYEKGKLKGFIGFDDCKNARIWDVGEIAAMSYIAKMLSIFILKKQISKELWLSYQNYIEMLDNMNGYVYVVDTSTFMVLYVNNAMKALNLSPGIKCHNLCFDKDVPCDNCPVKKLSSTVKYAEEEIYSLRINGWVNSAASKLTWTDGRGAALVCCTDISKYKK